MVVASLVEIPASPRIDELSLNAAAERAAQRQLPYVPETATLFLPGYYTVHDPPGAEVTDSERAAMERCLELGHIAMRNGNPPIGAVLLDHKSDQSWEAVTDDKTTGNLLGHAELNAYIAARATVGGDLRSCTLVTTAQPCTTCIGPLAEGKLGRVVFAAPRREIRLVSRLMRTRIYDMDDSLWDGDTTTMVLRGHLASDALRQFAIWPALRDVGLVNG
ncbi:MAG TPA: deaminase [Candidatus Saccharimonadales bacterium]|nr:deaminase [Candidatus Saccharimonadales bacterium]